ncbi:MAG TPA: glycosyltransferase [Urbifossiella sp.]|nr:glycosyltransferase [Urbifossiella sp.]
MGEEYRPGGAGGVTGSDACVTTPAEPGPVRVDGEGAPPASGRGVTLPATGRPVRVAILSLLFNWPSTGGGNIHTAELTKFLAAAGYAVRHLYARFDPWGVGRVRGPTPHPAEALTFAPAEWTTAGIQARFRAAVRAFDPDHVIITDSWNFKPLLADAVADYRYVLRLQALECLCPLNNLRLLPSAGGTPVQCHRHQLATPGECTGCVRDRGAFSGDLHRAERELSGVGTPEYRAALFRAFARAEAVLVVNPPSADMVRPYARDVRVVTAGMDPARFPWPPPAAAAPPGPARVLFAGLTGEWSKGFQVLRAACAVLWARRTDFELVVTDDRPAATDPFARYVGWQSQSDLVRHLYAADVVAVPVVGQEALGRTAVEAMAAGRSVVASRIGGLPFTVVDGETGLLADPGDPGDLARKLEILLADPALRERLGAAGRRRFEREYSWPVVVDTHYRPLFGDPTHAAPPGETPQPVGCVLAVQDRAADLVERTLRSYAWQSHAPADRVLVDYDSDPAYAAAYADLARRFGWRLVRAEVADRRWSSAAAYNLGIGALRPEVAVVFKSDADVLLGEGVLAAAARMGGDAFCKFQYLVAPRPAGPAAGPVDAAALFDIACGEGGVAVGSGCGLFACPAAWFRAVGGFDLAFRGWGYEDSDLLGRAERTLPVVDVSWQDCLLVHQWHLPAADARLGLENRAYYRYMRLAGPTVRNDGRLIPVAGTAGRPSTEAFNAVQDVLRQTLVVLVDRGSAAGLTRWLGAWRMADRGGARLVVVGGRRGSEEDSPIGIDPDFVLPPLDESDADVFAGVVSGRYDHLPPDWEFLLWCTADLAPLRQDFLLHYLHAAADPGVGAVVRWADAQPPSSRTPADRATAVLFRRVAARGVRFSAPPANGLGPAAGGLAAQVLGLGLRVAAVGGPGDRVMWDTGDERETASAALFSERFEVPPVPMSP